MSWIMTPEHLRPDWLPRAIVSGFVATIVMTLTYIVAYGLALLLAKTGFGGEVLAGWFDALVHNQVTDLAGANLYLALAIHSAAGLIWAIIYSYFVEPRLGGPAWQNGAMFSLVPWVLSLVAFLPLVGGGLFGLSIGAGPLPTLGNLILHLAYGRVTLRGQEVAISPTEYRLLCSLAAHPDTVLTRDHLLEEVWGSAYRGQHDILRVTLWRLRRKLEKDPSNPQYIITRPGLGYMLATAS